jgi:hypothetical protein
VRPFRRRGIDRRTFIKSAAAGAVGASFFSPDVEALSPSTTLYNGIRLPQPWPPDRRGLLDRPIAPPYLVDPPDVIPIDVGRQLFVDDFLIEETSLERTFHRATYHPDNPILRPTTQWERYDEYAVRTQTRSNPAAMVFSDGVFYDPQSRLFKMWYMGGYSQNTCYAFSHDGLTWEKPALDVVKGTNITLSLHRDSSTIWLDLAESDPNSRYKMSLWYDNYLLLYTSIDGIHWRERGRSGPAGDRTTVFFNPFRNVWVFSVRDQGDRGSGRIRRYFETPDFVEGARWKAGQPVQWTAADLADARRPEYNVPAELYNLDCVAYESLLLGLFTIFRGERPVREKPNDVCIGYSRDGFHWARPDREAFLPVSEQVGDWNWANVQSAGGCCLVVGDKLYFYVSGRRGVPGSSDPGICSTGLATLRRDGFVSMDHPASGRGVERLKPSPAPGTLITRPVKFSGRHLFVNIDAPDGELRVAILDREGRVIAPYDERACVPIRADSTRTRVTWTAAGDLAPLAGRDVRFRFHVTRGRLYAFWVSPTPDGASRGYVAAGGPGFTSAVDTNGGGQQRG